MARNRIGTIVLQTGIIGSGYMIVLYGMCALFGNVFYRDAVMNASGLRLTSVFQYANAYAAYLMALLLCCVYLLMKSNKWYLHLIHAFMLTGIILSFVLTLSRGGLVLLPIVILLVIPFLSVSRQILFFIHLLIGLAGALIISGKITNNAIDILNTILPTVKPDNTAQTISPFNALSLSCWVLYLSASIVVAILVYLANRFLAPILDKRLECFSNRKYAKVILPVLAIVIGVIGAVLLFADTGIKNILPATLKLRIENINFDQHSVLERATFYKDSIKLFKDYPVIGAGGGAWESLYEKYQNNPYTSRQTHSFFIQYLVEIGIVGFVILMFLIGYIFRTFIRSFGKSENSGKNLIYYIIAVSLLVHSLIDFEMSYAYLAALVFLCLGGMASIPSTDSAAFGQALFQGNRRFIYPGIVCVLSIVIFALSMIGLNANSNFNTARLLAENRRPLQEILVPLNRAINLQPNNPEFLLFMTDMMQQAFMQTKNEQYYNEMKNIVLHAKQNESNNRLIIESQFALFQLKNDLQSQLDLANRALLLFPWDTTYYERAMALHFELGNKDRLAGNQQAKEQHWNAVSELYNKVREKMKDLEKLPKGQDPGRPFKVTPNMIFTLGEMNFIKGDFKAATEFLKQGLTAQNLDKDPYRSIARWYIASLRKQNSDDAALYNQLVAIDPKEKNEIDRLVQANFAENKY